MNSTIRNREKLKTHCLCGKLRNDKDFSINPKTGELKILCDDCLIIKKEKNKQYRSTRAKQLKTERQTLEELDEITNKYFANNFIEQEVSYYPNTWSTIC